MVLMLGHFAITTVLSVLSLSLCILSRSFVQLLLGIVQYFYHRIVGYPRKSNTCGYCDIVVGFFLFLSLLVKVTSRHEINVCLSTEKQNTMKILQYCSMLSLFYQWLA